MWFSFPRNSSSEFPGGAQGSALPLPQGFIPRSFSKDLSLREYSTAAPRGSFAAGWDFFAVKREWDPEIKASPLEMESPPWPH